MRNSNSNNQNFLAAAAQSLYGAQRKKDEDEKSLRNSLLNELGNKLEPKHILYSSNDELKKMRDEMNTKKFQQRTQNNFRGIFLGAANSIDEAQNPLQVPLPESKIQQTPYVKNNDTKEPKVDLTNKPKLLDKIPVEREELVVSARFAPENWDEDKETPAVNYRENDNKKEIDNSFFSDDAIIKARNFIQGEEGFRDTAYKPTPNDKWTIGYGHTKNVKPGDKTTKEEAERLYKEDFNAHIAPLKDLKTPLDNNEKIALASLIYNIGPNAFKTSTLYKKLQAGDKKGAAEEFERWNKQNKQVLNGLTKRRKKEKELFLTPYEE